MRGAPGCGKSTFIDNMGLRQYTLSADEIRLQYSSVSLGIDGSECISQKHDNIVWKTLFEMLEYRMSNGCFTVIDATNSKTKEMSKYKNLADTYRYRVYVVDMTDVPLEVCKQRNKLRPVYKQVPEAALENIYSSLGESQIGQFQLNKSESAGIVEYYIDNYSNTNYPMILGIIIAILTGFIISSSEQSL
jgi:predicted kinase